MNDLAKAGGNLVRLGPRWELVAVAAFVIVQLVAPFVVGEVYPFTISPMFSDRPERYALYRVTDGAGVELDPAAFGLHLVYDGNPPGFGVGIAAPPTLHPFGSIASEHEVTARVREVLSRRRDLPRAVEVTQTVVSGGEAQLHKETLQWTVSVDRKP